MQHIERFRNALVKCRAAHKVLLTQPPDSGPRRDLSHRLPSKSVVFSGIQPTGIPHIGNWFGALRQWVDLQDGDAHLLYAVVDLHAITVPQEAATLSIWKRQALAVLLAIGIDPTRSTLFFQSGVPAHTKLMWILACQSSLGQLSRMTTWKSKISAGSISTSEDLTKKNNARLGLFAYPVLQAADILLYGAQYVPVGSDQTQHLEFTRECARNFNRLCGEQVLQEPTALYSTIPRVMSLRNPTRKMSKSDADPRSRILLTDSSEDIQRKVKASVTDSIDGITYEPLHRPGVANLIEMLSYLDKSGSNADILAMSLKNYSMRGLKELLSTQLIREITPIRESYRNLTETSTGLAKLDEIAELGAKKAAERAEMTMARVRKAIGLH